MKRRIWIKRKDRVKQRYWIGKKLKNYGAFSDKTDVPFVDFPYEYGYKKKKKMLTPEEFMQLARATSTDDEWRGKPLEEYKTATTLWHRDPSAEERLRKMGKSEEEIERFRQAAKLQEERLDKIKNALKSKEKIVPSPYIEFREGKPYEHEGRHRVIAAGEIGIKKVPVFFVYKKNEPTQE